MFYNYPGNIRELENIIEHACVLCPGGQLEITCLPEHLRTGPSPVAERGGDVKALLESAETRVILEVLERNRFNRAAAARELRIHKSTLYRKIRRLGIGLPADDGRAGSDSSR